LAAAVVAVGTNIAARAIAAAAARQRRRLAGL
jgi:hypothetical protein